MHTRRIAIALVVSLVSGCATDFDPRPLGGLWEVDYEITGCGYPSGRIQFGVTPQADGTATVDGAGQLDANRAHVPIDGGNGGGPVIGTLSLDLHDDGTRADVEDGDFLGLDGCAAEAVVSLAGRWRA